jgi:hypothetical protein
MKPQHFFLVLGTTLLATLPVFAISSPSGCRAESRSINSGVTTAYRVNDNDQYVYSGGAIETLQFTTSVSVSQVKICNSGRIIERGGNRYYINTSVN